MPVESIVNPNCRYLGLLHRLLYIGNRRSLDKYGYYCIQSVLECRRDVAYYREDATKLIIHMKVAYVVTPINHVKV